MGFITMRAPEDRSGLGMGLMEAALICEAAGRGAAPLPIADGIAACALLGQLVGEAAAALLDQASLTPISFDAQDGCIRLSWQSDAIQAAMPNGEARIIASGNAARQSYEAALTERTLLRSAWLVGAGTRAIEMAAGVAGDLMAFPVRSAEAVRSRGSRRPDQLVDSHHSPRRRAPGATHLWRLRPLRRI